MNLGTDTEHLWHIPGKSEKVFCIAISIFIFRLFENFSCMYAINFFPHGYNSDFFL